jgi:MFS family permease
MKSVTINESTQQYKLMEWVSFFLFAMGPLNLNAILVMLGPIAEDFSVDPTVVLIAIPAFMIPFAFLQLFTGGLSDVKGRIPVITFGLLVFASGMVIAAFSNSFEVFILAWVLGGIGFAFVNPVLIALITDIVPMSEIPKKMGILSAVGSISSGLGPLIAGQIVAFSWRYFNLLFLVITLIGLPIMVFAKRPSLPVLTEDRIQVLASSYFEELRRPIVVLLVLSSFMIYLPYSGITIWTSRALTGIYDPVIISLLLLLAAIVAFITGILMGWIIKQVGFSRTIIIGLSTLILAVMFLLLAGDITILNNLALVIIALLLAGIAGGALFTIVTTYSQRISPERRGILAGLTTATRVLGGALVPIIYEPLFNIGISMVYLAILFAAIILAFLLLSLHKFASNKIEIEG